MASPIHGFQTGGVPGSPIALWYYKANPDIVDGVEYNINYETVTRVETTNTHTPVTVTFTQGIPLVLSGVVGLAFINDLNAFVAGGGVVPVTTIDGLTWSVKTTTDDIPEGLVNLYFTDARAIAVGTTPGGSPGDIQFNNTGSLGGYTQVPLANGGTNVDLSASGSATAILAQDAAHVVSARSLVANDIPSLDVSKITTGVLAAARGGMSITETAGQGYFWGPGLINMGFSNPTDNNVFSASQIVRCVQFVCPFTITIRHISWNTTNAVGGTTMNIGIYDAIGTTKLLDSGFLSTASTSAATASVGPVTLEGGKVYYFAFSCTNTAVRLPAMNVLGNVITVFNVGAHRQGVTNQSTSGGVMPSSLSLTSGFTDSTMLVPIVLFEP